MENPWFIVPSIAASGTVCSPYLLALNKTRTVSLTVKTTFGASIDANATVYVLYSPDGTSVDNTATPYASFEITYSAGNSRTITKVIDPPEHGYLFVTITNGSSADVLTSTTVWYSIQSWENNREG